jgi:hypothetical protein
MLMDCPYTTTRTVSVGEGGACKSRAVRATYGANRAGSPVSGTGKKRLGRQGSGGKQQEQCREDRKFHLHGSEVAGQKEQLLLNNKKNLY